MKCKLLFKFLESGFGVSGAREDELHTTFHIMGSTQLEVFESKIVTFPQTNA